MNKFLILFLLLSGAAFGQNDISINFHHFINEEVASTEVNGSNNLENEYNLTRVEYYVSGINLIHDGGQSTQVLNKWLLVNAMEDSTFSLGTFNVTQLESLEFYIGVEDSLNHLDPSLYPADHPLAPKAPSMHWGWAGGYRFLAVEGVSEGEVFQVHVVGNVNYKKVSIAYTNATASNNVLEINLFAEYQQAIRGLNLSSGLIVHSGTLPEVKTVVGNFQNIVFSENKQDTVAVETTGISVEENLVANVQVFPNPNSGTFRITSLGNNFIGKVEIYNVLGEQIEDKKFKNEDLEITLKNSGIYFVRLYDKNNSLIANKKVIVRQ